jgi:hypothetical protein
MAGVFLVTKDFNSILEKYFKDYLGLSLKCVNTITFPQSFVTI